MSLFEREYKPVIYEYIFQVITTKSRLGNNQAKEWYSRIYKKYIFVRK